MTDAANPIARGYTPAELARLLRVSADRVRQWIASGELPAINTASHRCKKPRYVVLPSHLAEFERRHAAAQPPKAARRQKRSQAVDYYPD